jgi:hypothetical protein
VEITSHISGTSKAAVLVEHFRSSFCFFALLPALISLVVPAAAWGDVYKWTDAKGITVFSDILPKTGEKVKNFEVVAKAARPETKAQAQAVTPAEQAVLARVEMLERQLQAQQYAAAAPAVSPPTTYSNYYPPAPPPPPPSSSYYDSGYYGSGYDSGYYPSYYPSYTYPVVRSYSYAAYPARTFISRPVFAAPRGGLFHGGGGHVGGGFRGGGGGHSGGGHGGHGGHR